MRPCHRWTDRRRAGRREARVVASPRALALSSNFLDSWNWRPFIRLGCKFYGLGEDKWISPIYHITLWNALNDAGRRFFRSRPGAHRKRNCRGMKDPSPDRTKQTPEKGSAQPMSKRLAWTTWCWVKILAFFATQCSMKTRCSVPHVVTILSRRARYKGARIAYDQVE